MVGNTDGVRDNNPLSGCEWELKLGDAPDLGSLGSDRRVKVLGGLT
jgi:hypothetical protein